MTQLSGAAGPHPGRLVLLRDALGILSVMCCLDDGLVLDPVFQRDYREESAALEGLAETRVTAPLSYIVDATGRIVAVVRRHVEGVLLSDVLERMARGLDVQTAATVVKDVLTGLAALHRRGVAHRSIDPHHVIVEPRGGSVLIDPGLQPRAVDQRPGDEFVDDFALMPQLFASCVTTARLAPGADSQRYFAAGELEGVSRDLCLVLDEARRAALERWNDGGGVGGMLAAFNAAAADCFDAGWDDRGRERLASAAAQTPYPVRGRAFDFVPFADRSEWSRPRRGKRAGVPSAEAKVLGPELAEFDPSGANLAAAAAEPDVVASNPPVSSPGVSNPAVLNPTVPNPAASNTPVSNPGVSNPGASNPAMPSPQVPNPAALEPDLSGPEGNRTVTVWSTFPDSGPRNPGSDADAARRTRKALTRDRGISEAWQAALASSSRRASEWLGDNWRTGADTVRASVSGGELKGPPSRRARRRRLRVLISRIAVPFIAFLVALALSRIFLGGPVASRTNHQGGPAPAQSPITSSAPVAAQPPLPSASPSPSASTTSAAPPPAVQAATVSQSPAVTLVTSVSITSLTTVPGSSSEATVTVDVRASGAGTVNVTIQLTEPVGAGGFGVTLSHTDHFTESGQRAYTITDTLPLASYCSRNGGGDGGGGWSGGGGSGGGQAATVDVTAAAADSTDAPLTASGQVWPVRC